jgi:hypothetical protein
MEDLMRSFQLRHRTFLPFNIFDELKKCLQLIQSRVYVISQLMVGNPSNRKAYKQCKKLPSWTEYIFVRFLYRNVSSLHKQGMST